VLARTKLRDLALSSLQFDNQSMKHILMLILLASASSYASIVGISTHPLNQGARVFSAEMTGHLSQRQEVGMGLRYTQEIHENKLLDLIISGAQISRGLTMGGGIDVVIFDEDMTQPRISIKPHYQLQKYESDVYSLLGMAPTLRKGFSLRGNEFFPYAALPTGIKIDNDTDEFVYYSNLALGLSLPFPVHNKDPLLVSIEGNKNLGSSSDYVGLLISWIWK
jgi:hypothetical protein